MNPKHYFETNRLVHTISHLFQSKSPSCNWGGHEVPQTIGKYWTSFLCSVRCMAQQIQFNIFFVISRKFQNMTEYLIKPSGKLKFCRLKSA